MLEISIKIKETPRQDIVVIFCREQKQLIIRNMKNEGFDFRKPVNNLGILKYIMAEGPDHILFELFEVIRDKLSEDQYKLISSFR